MKKTNNNVLIFFTVLIFFKSLSAAGALPETKASVASSQKDLFKELFARDAKITIRDVSALLDICHHFNQPDSSGNSALHNAMLYGHCEEIIWLLLDHGADHESRNSEHHTPLQLAPEAKRDAYAQVIAKFLDDHAPLIAEPPSKPLAIAHA